ncbi:MAG: hypothetical protein ABI869_03270 [Actinomycetota bacterium]
MAVSPKISTGCVCERQVFRLLTTNQEQWVFKNVFQRVVVSVPVMTLALVACGSQEPSPGSGATATVAVPASTAPVANACPADGCKIKITDVARAGDEIAVTWDANFVPDVSKNHIHVYWDIYTSDQVSSDAESRGVTQGEWVPTDAYPTYVTGGAASVTKRGDSTTICVTAGDRDHVVIDSSIVDCRDVSDLL